MLPITSPDDESAPYCDVMLPAEAVVIRVARSPSLHSHTARLPAGPPPHSPLVFLVSRIRHRLLRLGSVIYPFDIVICGISEAQ